MPRKTEFGRYILSAGEIGAFTVCPESWRLRSVAKVKSRSSESADRGRELHREWASKFDESASLYRFARIILLLILFASSVYIALEVVAQ